MEATMKPTNEVSSAVPGDERTPDKTIGQVKYADVNGPKAEGGEVKSVDRTRGRFANALGEAVLECWPQLSQDKQQMLFEKAVVCGHHDERDESLREQLAEYLHDHHPKTAQ
jgi:hypothetical protein